MLIHIKTQQEYNDLISKGLVLVDFFANWCGPCRMLTPVLENLEDKINVVKVDIDKFEKLAFEYRIMSVPTLILFKDGEKRKEEKCWTLRESEKTMKMSKPE